MKRHIALGIIDGATIPLTLAAALSGMVVSSSSIFLAGILASLTGAITMTLGAWSAGKPTSMHHIHSPDLGKLGFNKNQETAALDALRQDQEELENLLHYQNDIRGERNKINSLQTVITIGFSYLLAGLLVSFPYLFFTTGLPTLLFASGIAFMLMALGGYLRASVDGTNKVSGIILAILTGALAAVSAFLLAEWIAGN